MEYISIKDNITIYENHCKGKIMDKRIIYFRADGNAIIGMGHIMRCLSIAQQIKTLGAEAKFIVSDQSTADFINDKGFFCYCLNSTWNDLNQELDKLKTLIIESNIKILVIDSYYINVNYLKILSNYTHTVYIDDLNSFDYPVEIIVNYNIYAYDIGYNRNKYKSSLLGTEYAPLRSEFENCPNRFFSGINKILLTSGSTDEYNVIGNVLSFFKEKDCFNELEFYCILGKFNRNSDVLKKQYSSFSNVNLLSDVTNISLYMKTCDIAITACGSTCYELCACGIPAVSYTLADNQVPGAVAFSEKGIIPYIGDVRNAMNNCISNIDKEINQLNNAKQWEKRSHMMQNLVDGNGSKRLALYLLKF